MDRGYMCAWEAWRTAGGEVHAVLHMVPACCAHGVCACCAHGVRMRCTCLRHIARPAIRAVDAWRGRAMATERAATVERGEARAYEQQRGGPCASKLGDPHRAAGGDEEEAQHLRCMGGAWGRSLARRRAAAWVQPGCSMGCMGLKKRRGTGGMVRRSSAAKARRCSHRLHTSAPAMRHASMGSRRSTPSRPLPRTARCTSGSSAKA